MANSDRTQNSKTVIIGLSRDRGRIKRIYHISTRNSRSRAKDWSGPPTTDGEHPIDIRFTRPRVYLFVAKTFSFVTLLSSPHNGRPRFPIAARPRSSPSVASVVRGMIGDKKTSPIECETTELSSTCTVFFDRVVGYDENDAVSHTRQRYYRTGATMKRHKNAIRFVLRYVMSAAAAACCLSSCGTGRPRRSGE